MIAMRTDARCWLYGFAASVMVPARQRVNKCNDTGKVVTERDIDGADVPCVSICWDCEERKYAEDLKEAEEG